MFYQVGTCLGLTLPISMAVLISQGNYKIFSAAFLASNLWRFRWNSFVVVTPHPELILSLKL